MARIKTKCVKCGKIFLSRSVVPGHSRNISVRGYCRDCRPEVLRQEYTRLIGKRYGRLTITGIVPVGKQVGKQIQAYVLCDCGNIKQVSITGLERGNNTSCGCNRTVWSSLAKTGMPNLGAAKPFEYTLLKQIYNGYRGSAKAREFEFNITFLEFMQIVHQPCHYCGRVDVDKRELANEGIVHKGRILYCNGIDRIDSSKGYIAGNYVPCCAAHNNMKWDSSVEDFIKNCGLVADFAAKANLVKARA